MTTREKNLLFLLIGALFLVLNFLAYKNFYEGEMTGLEKRINAAQSDLGRAEVVLAQRSNWDNAERWLNRSEGKGIAYQTAQANLQAYVEREAKKRGLVVRDQRIIPWQEGAHYNRVRVRFKVTGMEQQIQQWILALNQNRQLQVLTKFDVKPTRGDLTKADCEVEVEKYILPPVEPPTS